MTSNPVTMFDCAGGRTALLRLAEAQYRRCLTDPLLTEIFGVEGKAGRVEHLADWLTEVLGRPKLYTERHGGHGALLGRHAGLQIDETRRQRFVAVSQPGADTTSNDPVPVSDWGPAGPPPR